MFVRNVWLRLDQTVWFHCSGAQTPVLTSDQGSTMVIWAETAELMSFNSSVLCADFKSTLASNVIIIVLCFTRELSPAMLQQINSKYFLELRKLFCYDIRKTNNSDQSNNFKEFLNSFLVTTCTLMWMKMAAAVVWVRPYIVLGLIQPQQWPWLGPQQPPPLSSVCPHQLTHQHCPAHVASAHVRHVASEQVTGLDNDQEFAV